MSRRQNKFAQKRYNISSEEVNVYSSTLADFKLKGYRILTELDLGVSSFGVVGNTANANAALVTSGVAHLQPASGAYPGLVGLGDQTFPNGTKTFTGPIAGTSAVFSSTVTASNISGGNTGDVTLTGFGSAPSANGATLAGQALTLQPADATHPGGLSTAAQPIGGPKTFVETVTGQKNFVLPLTTTTVGTLQIGDTKLQATRPVVGAPTFPNIFLGAGVGNTTATGENNLVVGGGGHSTGFTTSIGNTILNCQDGFTGPIDSNDNIIANCASGSVAHGSGNVVLSGGGGGAIDVWTGVEEDNLYLAAVGPSESSTIRIGDSHTRCFVKGIDAVTGIANSTPVMIDGFGQLSTTTFINELCFFSIPGQTSTVAGAQLTLNNTIIPASDDGITVSGSVIHLSKKGSYLFKVTLHMNVESIVYCQFRIGGSASDSGVQATKVITGHEASVNFVFMRTLPVDASIDVDFFVAADTYPAAGGAAPTFNASGGVELQHINLR